MTVYRFTLRLQKIEKQGRLRWLIYHTIKARIRIDGLNTSFENRLWLKMELEDMVRVLIEYYVGD